MKAVFADTSYYLALINSVDKSPYPSYSIIQYGNHPPRQC